MLPLVKKYFSFGEGGTPCIKSRVLGPEKNILLYFKDEGQNPTGSFKDRAATVLVSTERELGHFSGSTFLVVMLQVRFRFIQRLPG